MRKETTKILTTVKSKMHSFICFEYKIKIHNNKLFLTQKVKNGNNSQKNGRIKTPIMICKYSYDI